MNIYWWSNPGNPVGQLKILSGAKHGRGGQSDGKYSIIENNGNVISIIDKKHFEI
ncbi:hypothetical protein ACTHQT_19115 [Cytobacillus praedii]|uniref:hypothetical protein n=1 Tax=Cytobacillus praedii TaxID=1742358 RepID=UPI003F813D40